MIKQKILPDELQSFDYYVNKLPIYLQQSYGFIEHFRIWYDLHTGETDTNIVAVIEKLFEMLNIFDLNCDAHHDNEYDANLHYLEFLNSIEDNEGGTASDLLDKIGALFGLKRRFSIDLSVKHKLSISGQSNTSSGNSFSITIYNISGQAIYNQEIPFNDDETPQQLLSASLTDIERIVVTCDSDSGLGHRECKLLGTNETIQLENIGGRASGTYYISSDLTITGLEWSDEEGDPVIPTPVSQLVTKEFNLNNKDFLILVKCTIIRNYFDGSYAELAKYYKSVGLPVFIMTTVDNLGDYYNARCRMDLIDVQGSIYEQSQDVKDLFLAGMLTVQSMGIQYEYYVHVPTYIAIFDGADAYSKFDSQGVFV